MDCVGQGSVQRRGRRCLAQLLVLLLGGGRLPGWLAAGEAVLEVPAEGNAVFPAVGASVEFPFSCRSRWRVTRPQPWPFLTSSIEVLGLPFCRP